MDELRTFIELQERLEANQARKAYVAAMAEFKRNPSQIVKDKFVSFEGRDVSNTSYMHATLGSVCARSLRDSANKTSRITGILNNLVWVTCTITHSMGHSEVTRMQAQPDASGKKNAIQQIASTITYLQRYLSAQRKGDPLDFKRADLKDGHLPVEQK